MLATVTDTRNNGVTVTVHNIAIQQWSFNHRGTATLAGVPKLGTVLGDLVKVALFVQAGVPITDNWLFFLITLQILEI